MCCARWFENALGVSLEKRAKKIVDLATDSTFVFVNIRKGRGGGGREEIRFILLFVEKQTNEKRPPPPKKKKNGCKSLATHDIV